MEYVQLYEDLVIRMKALEALYNDKHTRLVECLAELLCRKKQIERRDAYILEMNTYCDAIEEMCPVAHGQRRPKLDMETWECTDTDLA